MAPTRSPKKKRRTPWTVATKKTPRKAKTEKLEKKDEKEGEEEEELWEVEYIQEARCKLQGEKFTWHYRVKWLNWAHEDNSWELYGNFAADSDILQTFWDDIDDNYGLGDGDRKNVDIEYAGRRCFPSNRWINERKAMAVKATDLRLHKAPDPRAVSPFHGAEPTVAESQWRQGGKDDDDDPGSQSESECASVYHSDDDDGINYGESTPELEEHRNAAGRVYASIPDNPRRYYRKDKMPRQELCEWINTPRDLGQRTRKAERHPDARVFIKPTRDDGILRANKKGNLELHARGPVRAPPKPIRLFSAEEYKKIEEERYENFKALLQGTLPPSADEDEESENEVQPADEYQDTPASPLDPHEEFRRLKQKEPLFHDENRDDDREDIESNFGDDDNANFPPSSSPVPESPRSPPATPPHDRLAMRSFLAPIPERPAEEEEAEAQGIPDDIYLPVAGPAYDEDIADVFGSSANPRTGPPPNMPMPEVDLEEFISDEFLDAGDEGLDAIWERGPSMDTLATQTVAGDAEEAGPQTDQARAASATAQEQPSQPEADGAAMDVDNENQIEAAELDLEENVEAALEEDLVEAALENNDEAAPSEDNVAAALEDEHPAQDDSVDVESELEEGEIRE